VKAPKNKQSAKDLKEWDKAWEKVVKKIPPPEEGPQPIASLLTHIRGILSYDKHPLSEIFNHAIDVCASEATAVKDIGSDEARQQLIEIIVACLKKLVPAMTTFYKTLKTRSQWVEEGLFELLFQRLHPVIFKQYIIKYKEEDEQCVAKFKMFNYLTPAHLGIQKRFWLTEERKIAPNTPVEQLPYGSSIAILRQLPTFDTPNSCVQCLADAGGAIYASVHNYWGDRLPPDKLSIAADDFLPLFAYVAVRSQIEHPLSTCKYLCDFLGDTLSGEKAYNMVTFQTCLTLILELSTETLEKTIAAGFGERQQEETNPLIARMVPEDIQEQVKEQLQTEVPPAVDMQQPEQPTGPPPRPVDGNP